MKASEIPPLALVQVAARGSGRIMNGRPSRTMTVRVECRAARTLGGRRSAMLTGTNLATGRRVRFHPCRVISILPDQHVSDATREAVAVHRASAEDRHASQTDARHREVSRRMFERAGHADKWGELLAAMEEPSDADPVTGTTYGGLA